LSDCRDPGFLDDVIQRQVWVAACIFIGYYCLPLQTLQSEMVFDGSAFSDQNENDY
jgi:hypothetical protein